MRLFFVVGVLCALCRPSLRAADSSLDGEIHAAVAGFPGTVSIYAKNLDTGKTFGMGEDRRVRTASTIKLPILASIFDSIERGDGKWTDMLELTAGEKISGSGVLTEFSDGDRFPIRDLAHLMIVVSDNTATNLLLSRFPGDGVNAYLDKIGLTQTRVMRKILGAGPARGTTAAGKIPGNAEFGIGVSTPKEMVRLLEMLNAGKVVNEAASQEMIAILKRQQDRNGIVRRLGDTVVADKTGALDHLRSDVGIVYSTHGKIAMAITCDGIPNVLWTSDNKGLLLIADVAKILVDRL